MFGRSGIFNLSVLHDFIDFNLHLGVSWDLFNAVPHFDLKVLHAHLIH